MRKRFRELGFNWGNLSTGPLNRISDVPGVLVGHKTLICDEPTTIRTGVTAIVPRSGVFNKPVTAACSVLNGYGKSLGLIQVEELGQIETPIVLTNTLAVGQAFQGIVDYVKSFSDVQSINPVVGECNDGFLNDIRFQAVRPEHVIDAINNAQKCFSMGTVGAGTGMVCFGFKGGIGSSSRRIVITEGEFFVGALVLANFGSFQDLLILNVRVKDVVAAGIKRHSNPSGSIIIILGTNAPLTARQLKRLANHSFLALGMLGAPGYHGSGDVCIAFSTTEGRVVETKETFDQLFRATVESVYEAVCDSLFCAETLCGFKGTVKAIPISELSAHFKK